MLLMYAFAYKMIKRCLTPFYHLARATGNATCPPKTDAVYCPLRRFARRDIRGHRQVVRHQLPKLTSAGSSPVARSRKYKGSHFGSLICMSTLHGLEPQGREAEETRERFPASVQGREAPAAADSRSEYASPVARSSERKGSQGWEPFFISIEFSGQRTLTPRPSPASSSRWPRGTRASSHRGSAWRRWPRSWRR